MNTKLLAIAAFVILLLGGGALYLFSQNKPQTQDIANQAATESEKSSGKSLVDLISSGQSQRCTFEATNENGSTKGTAYVSGNNARTDIATTVDGNESEISMIRKGNDSYIWGSDLEQGIKMTLSLEELSTNEKANQYAGSVNPNEKVDFSCMPWTVDESLFTPPSNVKFTELSSNPCDQITDPEAKTACENAMQQ